MSSGFSRNRGLLSVLFSMASAARGLPRVPRPSPPPPRRVEIPRGWPWTVGRKPHQRLAEKARRRGQIDRGILTASNGLTR